MKYTIVATIEGTGRIQHIVSGAHSPEGAQEVIKRAYPGKTIIFEKCVRVKE